LMFNISNNITIIMHLAILIFLVCAVILFFVYIFSIFSCRARLSGDLQKKMLDLEQQNVNDDDNNGDDNPNAPVAPTCGIKHFNIDNCSSESEFED